MWRRDLSKRALIGTLEPRTTSVNRPRSAVANSLESRSERACRHAADESDRRGGQVASNDITTKLGAVPLFSGCSNRELGVISKAAKQVSHKQETVLAREGDRGVGLFLILDG